MGHAIEMDLRVMINLISLISSGLGVQAILRFYFRNFRGRNVGITEGRNL
jgi:hypothetical protein